jgi:hypothetical protein
MKTKNFVFKYLALFIIVFLNIKLGVCGSGGGSGIPITPYENIESVTENRVLQIREISKRIRSAVISCSGYYSIFKFSKFIGFRMINMENLRYDEPLDYLPEGFNLKALGIEKISFYKKQNKVIFNGLMSIQERNKILSKTYQISNDEEFQNKFNKAINCLFFKPRITNEILFYIEGFDENGKHERFFLSDIENIKIIKIDKQNLKMLLEISLFPDISPKELLFINPTYTELKKFYNKIKKLWINLKEQNNKSLFIAEVNHKNDRSLEVFINRDRKNTKNFDFKWFNEKEYFVWSEIEFEKLQVGDEILLKYPMYRNEIWWAIDSVIKDIHYPYRLYFGIVD